MSHLILGSALIGFAVWLQRTEAKGWPNESFDCDTDRDYLVRRGKLRRSVNGIFGLCGGLVLVAGLGGPQVFILSWMAVTFALLLIVIMAGFDAIRTHRYHAAKLPEIRRRMLGSSDE